MKATNVSPIYGNAKPKRRANTILAGLDDVKSFNITKNDTIDSKIIVEGDQANEEFVLP